MEPHAATHSGAEPRRVTWGVVSAREFLRRPGGGGGLPEDDPDPKWPLGLDDVVPQRSTSGDIISCVRLPTHLRTYTNAAFSASRACIKRTIPSITQISSSETPTHAAALRDDGKKHRDPSPNTSGVGTAVSPSHTHTSHTHTHTHAPGQSASPLESRAGQHTNGTQSHHARFLERPGAEAERLEAHHGHVRESTAGSVAADVPHVHMLGGDHSHLGVPRGTGRSPSPRHGHAAPSGEHGHGGHAHVVDVPELAVLGAAHPTPTPTHASGEGAPGFVLSPPVTRSPHEQEAPRASGPVASASRDNRPGVCIVGTIDEVAAWKERYDQERRAKQTADLTKARGRKRRGAAAAAARALSMGLTVPLFRCLNPSERRLLLEADRVDAHFSAEQLAMENAAVQAEFKQILQSRRASKKGCQCMVLSMSDLEGLSLKKLKQQLTMFNLSTEGSREEMMYRLLLFSREHGGCMHPKPPSLSTSPVTVEEQSPRDRRTSPANATEEVVVDSAANPVTVVADAAGPRRAGVTADAVASPGADSPEKAGDSPPPDLMYLHADAHEFCGQPRHNYANQPLDDAHTTAVVLSQWVEADQREFFERKPSADAVEHTSAPAPTSSPTDSNASATSPPSSPGATSSDSSSPSSSPSALAALVAKVSLCPCAEAGIGCHWGTCWCCQDCCSNRKQGESSAVDVEADVYRQMIGLLTHTRREHFLDQETIAAAWLQLKAAASDEDSESESGEESGSDVTDDLGLAATAALADATDDDVSTDGEADENAEMDETEVQQLILAAAAQNAAVAAAAAAGRSANGTAGKKDIGDADVPRRARRKAKPTHKPVPASVAVVETDTLLEVDDVMVPGTEANRARAGKRRRRDGAEKEPPAPSDVMLAEASAVLTEDAGASTADFLAHHRKRARNGMETLDTAAIRSDAEVTVLAGVIRATVDDDDDDMFAWEQPGGSSATGMDTPGPRPENARNVGGAAVATSLLLLSPEVAAAKR